MAYSNKYRITFDTIPATGASQEVIATISEDGFSGSVAEVDAGSQPLVFNMNEVEDDVFDIIKSVTAKVTIVSTTNFQFIEFYNAAPYQYRLIVTYGGTQVFRGWLDYSRPYVENYMQPPYFVEVFFNDGLALLKDFNYDETLTGNEELMHIIFECLENIWDSGDSNVRDVYTAQYFQETSLTLTDYDHLSRVLTDQKQFREGRNDDGTWVPMSAYDALYNVLKSMQCQIRGYGGNFYIFNPQFVGSKWNDASFGWIFYSWNGTTWSRDSVNNQLDFRLDIDQSEVYLLSGSFFKALLPFNRIRAFWEPDGNRNLLNGDFSDPDQWSDSTTLNDWSIVSGDPGVTRTTRAGVFWLRFGQIDPLSSGGIRNTVTLALSADGIQVNGRRLRLSMTYMLEENAGLPYTMDSTGQITSGPTTRVQLEMRINKVAANWYWVRDNNAVNKQNWLTSNAASAVWDVLNANSTNSWAGLELNKELTHSTELILNTWTNDAVPLIGQTGDIELRFDLNVGDGAHLLVKEIKITPVDDPSELFDELVLTLPNGVEGKRSFEYESPINDLAELTPGDPGFLQHIVNRNLLLTAADTPTTEWREPDAGSDKSLLRTIRSNLGIKTVVRQSLTCTLSGRFTFLDWFVLSVGQTPASFQMAKSFSIDAKREQGRFELVQIQGTTPQLSGEFWETADGADTIDDVSGTPIDLAEA